MKKIMFFDIDGTLLDFATHAIPDTTQFALKELKNKGIIIGLATGRQDITYKTLFYPEIVFDFVISSNGRMVKVDDEMIHLQTIPQDVIDMLISYDIKYNVSLLFESGTALAIHREGNEMCYQYMDGIGIEKPSVNSNFYLEEDVTQAMIFCDEKTEQIFIEAFPELHFVRHAGNGIDIVTMGPMKEKGVEVILDYYNLSQNDALAFGDGMNDISMFEYIDGVCLGKSHPDLITVAIEHIGNIEEDGLFNYLKTQHYI